MSEGWISTNDTTDVFAALATVPWRAEPGLLLILAAHPLLLALTLLLRRRCWALFCLLLLLLGSVLLADVANRQLALHWRRLRFSEQYFDSPGFFISAVWSVPALVNCTVILAMLVYRVMQLTVTKEQARLSRKADKQS